MAGNSAFSWRRGGVVSADPGCLTTDCAHYIMDVFEVLIVNVGKCGNRLFIAWGCS